MGDTFYNGVDRWNVPDDRQLALRGRLETGWSSFSGDSFGHHNTYITDEEQDLIIAVLQKQEMIQLQEQHRIGKLVKKLEHMRKSILGDGVTTCLICGTKAGYLKDQLHYCGNCGKMVCSKCGIEVQESCDRYGKCYLCVLCNEDKMLWKRSGAWFYNAIPKYTIPETNNNTPTSNRNRQGSYISFGSPNSSPLNQKSSSDIDLQRSQDSFDGSDDSDIEDTSGKAFEIPEDNMSICYINTDEESRSLRSSNSPNLSTKRRSTVSSNTMSSVDEADVLQHRKQKYSDISKQSANRSNAYETTSLHSNSSQKESGPTTKMGVFQKMNRDDFLDVSTTPSHNLSLSDDKVSRSNSNSSALSEQDIDAMFQSYEGDKSEEKEYHGKYGMIKFTVQYDPNTQELLIIIGSCRGLKFGDKGTISSPYVKTVILPVSLESAKASKKRTPAIKKSADPVFNFSIVYPGISDADIESKGIRLSVMEESSFGNDATIGETCIPLKGLGTRPVQQFRRILDLRANDECLFLDTKKGESNPGRIELALHYLSKQEKLVVGIIRCVGLKALDPNGYSDPYVKCYLLPDPHKKTKRKTGVKKKTLNPEFNEEFQYDITHAELAKRTLYISVWDHDVGRTNDFIGSLTLGIDSSGDILRHWFDTLKTADRRVIRWHNLSEDYPNIE